MKKQMMIPVAFAILAVVFAVGTAFSGGGKDKKAAKPIPPYYFHFSGSSGQEDDETKWDQITATQYSVTYASCNQTNDGCKLRTDSVQTISGTLRPKLVEVTVSGTHKNPKTSTESGVDQVGQLNP